MEDIPGQFSSVGVPVVEHSFDPVIVGLCCSSCSGFFFFPQCHEGDMPGIMRLKDRI